MGARRAAEPERPIYGVPGPLLQDVVGRATWPRLAGARPALHSSGWVDAAHLRQWSVTDSAIAPGLTRGDGGPAVRPAVWFVREESL